MRWSFALVAFAASAALAAPARADDGGRVVAGGIAGFVGGMLVGNALSHPYPPPPPRYSYVYDDPPDCHWERGPRYWDDYEGVWRHRRVRVCD